MTIGTGSMLQSQMEERKLHMWYVCTHFVCFVCVFYVLNCVLTFL